MIATNEESGRIAPQYENKKEQPIRHQQVIGSKIIPSYYFINERFYFLLTSRQIGYCYAIERKKHNF